MPGEIPDDAAFLLFQRILWQSMIVSPGVPAEALDGIQFILSDLYFSVILLYL